MFVRPLAIKRFAKIAVVYSTPSISTFQTGDHNVMLFAGYLRRLCRDWFEVEPLVAKRAVSQMEALKLSQEIATLNGTLPEQYATNLQQASVSLQAYRAAVSQYRDSQVATAAAIEAALRGFDFSH